jgi:cytochrome c1
MLIRLFFIIFSFLYANTNWFITNYEYGKMLYNNPRGISCAKCHGKKGNGKVVTYFVNSKGTKTVIKTAPIKNITFEKLKKALFHQIKIKPVLKQNPGSLLKYINIMPKYDYLTDDEIKAILLYLNSKDKQ